ncbi:hypothetical protein [Microlunatus sp. GCM10028923]|uniref:hypothetical protein n=1 Tax=Microlunatus sp. GCM10028923 TaxID=3273400 RepID=UPI003622241D
MTEPPDEGSERTGWHGFDEPWPDEETTVVCPRHLRFVPCRRCEPGQETRSSDPADVERTMRFQWGDAETDRFLGR